MEKNIYFQPSYKCEGVWDKRMGVAGVVVVAALINLVAAEVGDVKFWFKLTCARLAKCDNMSRCANAWNNLVRGPQSQLHQPSFEATHVKLNEIEMHG